MIALSTRIKPSGHLYIPRCLGPARASWSLFGDAVTVTVTQLDKGAYRREIYLLPRGLAAASFHKRLGRSVRVRLNKSNGRWVGTYELKPGWRERCFQ
jgi:hypothetical protein